MPNRESKESHPNSFKRPISRAVSTLKAHAKEIITVRMWALKMGYEDPQSFSDEFRLHFGKRPQAVLMAVRTKKAVTLIWQEKLSNFEIALELELRNEKGLYQFIKRQTNYSPNQIKSITDQDFRSLIKRLDNIISE